MSAIVQANRVILLLGVIYFGSTVVQSAEPYAWPLAQPRALTSSFGEYRTDRFHMGIDLRTGPIGKDVYAAMDGYVARVRCSPFGYGKVVYVQLQDGNMAIYAHLSDFMPPLREYVQKAQHDRKNYSVDLYPDPRLFPVVRGQRIAKSGQTGIGVPHLHWEIRNNSGVPINPRLLNLSWPDSTSPRFRSILVIPTTPDTTINGDYLPVVIAAKKMSNGKFTTGEISVLGAVAFGIDIYDPANGGATKLGVHRVTTSVDGDVVFEMNHDRISYLHASDGAVAYHPYYRDKGKFLMQWKWPGVSTELYGDGESKGEVRVTDQRRKVSIQAADFLGNSASVDLVLKPDSPDNEQWNGNDTPGSGTISYDVVGYWLLISVAFSEPEAQTPVLLESGSPSASTVFDRVSSTTFRARYRPAPNARSVGLSIDHPRAGLHPSSGTPVEHRFLVTGSEQLTSKSGIKDVHFEIPEAATFDRLYLTAGTQIAVAAKELTPMGPAYRFWPDAAPLRASITLRLPLPPIDQTPGSVGVYRKSGKSWNWIDAKTVNKEIRFETRKLGTFQLMVDKTEPRVLFRSPGRSGGVDSAKPRIEVFIDDRGSGIANWTVSYRGDWLLMAYDPEQHLLVWERDVSLPSGDGELLVSVEDEAGNVTRKSIRLQVPGI